MRNTKCICYCQYVVKDKSDPVAHFKSIFNFSVSSIKVDKIRTLAQLLIFREAARVLLNWINTWLQLVNFVPVTVIKKYFNSKNDK